MKDAIKFEQDFLDNIHKRIKQDFERYEDARISNYDKNNMDDFLEYRKNLEVKSIIQDNLRKIPKIPYFARVFLVKNGSEENEISFAIGEVMYTSKNDVLIHSINSELGHLIKAHTSQKIKIHGEEFTLVKVRKIEIYDSKVENIFDHELTFDLRKNSELDIIEIENYKEAPILKVLEKCFNEYKYLIGQELSRSILIDSFSDGYTELVIINQIKILISRNSRINKEQIFYIVPNNATKDRVEYFIGTIGLSRVSILTFDEYILNELCKIQGSTTIKNNYIKNTNQVSKSLIDEVYSMNFYLKICEGSILNNLRNGMGVLSKGIVIKKRNIISSTSNTIEQLNKYAERLGVDKLTDYSEEFEQSTYFRDFLNSILDKDKELNKEFRVLSTLTAKGVIHDFSLKSKRQEFDNRLNAIVESIDDLENNKNILDKRVYDYRRYYLLFEQKFLIHALEDITKRIEKIDLRMVELSEKVLKKHEINMVHSQRLLNLSGKEERNIQTAFIDLISSKNKNEIKQILNTINPISVYINYLFEISLGSDEDNARKYFFIDGVQNYTKAQINVLKKTVHKNSVWILYYDANDFPDESKIRVTELEEIIRTEKYSLIACHRTPVSIVEYINQKLYRSIIPVSNIVGLVHEVYFSVLPELIKKLRLSKSCRVAFIYSPLNKYMHTENYNKVHEILENDIDLLCATDSIGLEFDLVIVDTESMDNHMKYMSFTRSRNALIVVKY